MSVSNVLLLAMYFLALACLLVQWDSERVHCNLSHDKEPFMGGFNWLVPSSRGLGLSDFEAKQKDEGRR